MTDWQWKVIMALVRIVYNLVKYTRVYADDDDLDLLIEAMRKERDKKIKRCSLF